MKLGKLDDVKFMKRLFFVGVLILLCIGIYSIKKKDYELAEYAKYARASNI